MRVKLCEDVGRGRGGAIYMNSDIPGLFTYILLALVCIGLLLSPYIHELIP
jgi:hypothetical protein